MASISECGTGSAAPTAVSATSRAAMLGRLGALAAVAVMLTGTAPVTRLDVTLDNLRSTKGVVRVCLTADPANFPGCVEDADAVKLNVPAAAGRFTLPALPHGRYAMAVIHDENSNGRLDTFAGIPREGYGFSRNPAARFGPPRFDAARFDVAMPIEEQRITLKYIF